MDNKTLPIPDEKGGYVIQLAVSTSCIIWYGSTTRYTTIKLIRIIKYDKEGHLQGVNMFNVEGSMGTEHLDHFIRKRWIVH